MEQLLQMYEVAHRCSRTASERLGLVFSSSRSPSVRRQSVLINASVLERQHHAAQVPAATLTLQDLLVPHPSQVGSDVRKGENHSRYFNRPRQD